VGDRGSIVAFGEELQDAALVLGERFAGCMLECAVREQTPMNDRSIPEPRAARLRYCAAELFASGLLDCDNTLLNNDLVEDLHDRSNP
jgi:hypothetical protein